jgi:hypothetical protein
MTVGDVYCDLVSTKQLTARNINCTRNEAVEFLKHLGRTR